VTPTSVVSATSGIDKMAQSIPAGAHAEKESCASGDADTVERTRAREGKERVRARRLRDEQGSIWAQNKAAVRRRD
jgi:hypothetical protein